MLRTKMSATIAGAALLIAQTGVQAAEEVGQAYIKGLGTWIGADDDRNVKDDVAGGLVGFGYALSEHWNIEADFQSLSLDGKGQISDGEGGTMDAPDQRQTALSLNVMNLYNRGGLFAPYLLAGIGVVNTDIKGGRDADDLQLQGGVGVLTRLLDSRLSLRTEVLYRWQDASDSLDDVLVNAGLSYAFGRRAEAAPVAAAPVVAAPPPPADSDGDGVPDSADQCPGTPPGARVDSRGCELDSDGDGVVDRLDECPGTPAGAKVDARGCEEEIVLRGVNFELNSDQLTGQDRQILDSVADILRQRDRFSVEVQGHTDSLGRDAYNMDLSKRRANTVRDYLIGKGVPADTLTAVGFGETQPIATNDTADGRALNRRVTLQFTERAN